MAEMYSAKEHLAWIVNGFPFGPFPREAQTP